MRDLSSGKGPENWEEGWWSRAENGEVIGVGGVVAGRRVRVEGREGLSNCVSFKVSRGNLALNAFLLTFQLSLRRGSRLIFQASSILYHSTIVSKEPRLEVSSFMSAQGASDYRFFD